MDKRLRKRFMKAASFAAKDTQNAESYFYTPYFYLLLGLFPLDEDYVIAVQNVPITYESPFTKVAVNFVTYLVVYRVVTPPTSTASSPSLPSARRERGGSMGPREGSEGAEVVGGAEEDHDIEKEVENEEYEPIFFIQVKSPTAIENNSSRESADKQMRVHFGSKGFIAATEKLAGVFEGVSAIGTNVCFYKQEIDGGVRQITPPKIPPHPLYETDVAPGSWWEHDTLQEEGYRKFVEVVQRVKERADNLLMS
ncbi:hypothetical protein HK097_009312 [Rhizophlyctis rosea]|uniref:Uncharacterized protein n=1 Tax=Rhizophlyctis rosea TaxID=64517 RepID=A0AAD5SHB9_9FUNG|nr:hypothetical protein HK097_009312 [Rhizophlyctis rosea]